jgi:hypothetical protein
MAPVCLDVTPYYVTLRALPGAGVALNIDSTGLYDWGGGGGSGGSGPGAGLGLGAGPRRLRPRLQVS